MFRIIGGDSRQYGPVTVDEVRDWIRLGRAGAQTLAQREGEAEWKPLSSFAEFADAFAGASTLPEAGGVPALEIPAVAEGPFDPERLAEDAMFRARGVLIGDALGRGWDLFRADFWPLLGVTALVLVIAACANSAFVGPLVTGPLMGGLGWYLIKKVRRQPAQLSDAFVGFTSAFLPLFLGFLVSTLLAGLGMMLCLIPGIYLAVAWQFTLLLIVDKKLEFWPAMEVSRKVISRDWWGFFGFAIVSWLLNAAGALCLGVGIFLTMPWTFLAFLCLYEDRFGSSTSGVQAR